MKNFPLKRGYKIEVHAYKYGGKIYRSWKGSQVFDNNANELILVNDKVLVTEKNGGRWKTNNFCFWIFPKNAWYNILIFKNNGLISFYVNIASPYVFDGLALKYIDFDVDLKVEENGDLKTKDLHEFDKHSKELQYPEKIKKIVFSNLEIVKKMVINKTNYFDENFLKKIFFLYENEKH